MSDMVKVQRALVSVSDKTGIVEFVSSLVEMGVEIISTGGTAKALKAAGIDVIAIEPTQPILWVKDAIQQG